MEKQVQTLEEKEREEICEKLDAQFNGEVWDARPIIHMDENGEQR